MFELGEPPDYEPTRRRACRRGAAREGVEPEALALRPAARRAAAPRCCTCRSSTTRTATSTPSARCSPTRTPCSGSATAARTSARSATRSFPTTMLTHWVRDRTRGERFEAAVASSSARRRTRPQRSGCSTAACSRRAMRADVNVIDLDASRSALPTLVFDLPAGGKRLLQRADGLPAHLRRRHETYADGEPHRRPPRPARPRCPAAHCQRTEPDERSAR